MSTTATRNGLTLIPLLAASVVLSCGGSPQQSPSAVASSPPASPEASTPAVVSPAGSPSEFTSERYSYALRLPTGWYMRSEGPGKWTPFEISYFGAGTDSFEEDYEGRGEILDFPGITYGFYVSASELSKPTTLDAWTDLLASTMHSGSSCQGAPERESMTVDGEPAIVLNYDRADCTHDHHVLVVGVIHGKLGYDLVWLAKRGEDDLRRNTFDALTDTFEWTG